MRLEDSLPINENLTVQVDGTLLHPHLSIDIPVDFSLRCDYTKY